jgi:hypothetical protein
VIDVRPREVPLPPPFDPLPELQWLAASFVAHALIIYVLTILPAWRMIPPRDMTCMPPWQNQSDGLLFSDGVAVSVETDSERLPPDFEEFDDYVIIQPPRRRRALPKMEVPWEKKKPVWETRKLVLKITAGRPSEWHDSKRNVEGYGTDSFQKMAGDAIDFVSDKAYRGKGTYDIAGAGGGGGGRYGVAETSRDAVHTALGWLARHQNEDGSWSAVEYHKQCNRDLPTGTHFEGGKCLPGPGRGDFDAGVTGLATLAFLGAGYTPSSDDTWDGIRYGDVVRKALKWIVSRQDTEGCIGGRDIDKHMYNHILCALALCEGHRLSGAKLFEKETRAAVDFTLAAQNPGSGWRYTSRAGESDSFVTGWVLLQLQSATSAGIDVPLAARAGALDWFSRVSDPDFYFVPYSEREEFTDSLKEHSGDPRPHETCTALGILARIISGESRWDMVRNQACLLVLEDPPEGAPESADYHYWYLGTLALLQCRGSGGEPQRGWLLGAVRLLEKGQNQDDKVCRLGSWEPTARWCPVGGRVYATALNALTIQLFRGYEDAFGGSGW